MRTAAVCAGLLVGVLAGCSGEQAPAPATRAASPPSAEPATAAPKPDKLEDLTKGLDGKILAQHVDAKGADATWAGRFTAAEGYRVHLACVPGEAPGEFLVTVSGGTNISGACDGQPAMHELLTPDAPRKTYAFTVVVPFGAKWAVLIESV